MLLKREREQHPRSSSGWPPPKLPQHALPYKKLHQSLRIAHHQYQQEKTSHGPMQAKCWEISLRTEIGYSLKTIWSLKSQKKEEDNKQQQKTSPDVAKPKAKRLDTLSLNMTKTKQQWEAEMERLNSKYNLDCFSDSELDSESDEGEQYQYEHGYETLI